MDDKRNSEGRRVQKEAISKGGGGGWLLEVIFSAGSEIRELLRTNSWAYVEQAILL